MGKAVLKENLLILFFVFAKKQEFKESTTNLNIISKFSYFSSLNCLIARMDYD
ncbi:hypothetical protein NT05LM_0153 [Listeria marthii FSL S4-120]|uniref:Uncharacterized protein n=1 Tax=Listeria marthii FSL S4-120 TaxID=702457 RepID=A0ABN0C0Z4_9LIST|nr:hypothetical protein NT05LM_0153 [Listeria marthii FSL S4-120]